MISKCWKVIVICIALSLAFVTAGFADVLFSEYFGIGSDGNWHVSDESGAVLKNCWVCDDAVNSGADRWYYADIYGNVVQSGLVRDESGKYYLIVPGDPGYPGTLMRKSGSFSGVSVKPDASGAITDKTSIDGLKALFGEQNIISVSGVRVIYTANLSGAVSPTKTDIPKSSELYHNQNYLSSSANFTINNAGTNNTYIKLYSQTGDLVSCIFIRKKERVSIYLPGGTYRMRQAFGSTWYGMDQMFGAEGMYWQCVVNGSYDVPLKRAGVYVVSTSGSGEQISKEALDRNSF